MLTASPPHVQVDQLAAALHEPIDTIRLSSTKWADQFSEAVAYDGDGVLAFLVYLISLPWKVPPCLTYSPSALPDLSLLAECPA